jgi:signal transduction histidine kinase
MLFRQLAVSSRCRSTRAAVGFAIAVILSGIAMPAQADVEPKRVMMLHSFGLRFKPWTDYARIIRSEMGRQSRTPIDFHDYSLLNARQSSEKSEDPFVEYLHTIYADQPLDLIVALGAPAANFIQRYRKRLFPGTPMVFTSVEHRRIQHDELTENDTVIAIAHDLPALMENILRVLPLTKTIAIVNGTSPNEMYWLGEIRREFAPLAGRVEFKWYNEMSFEDILKDAARLPPHSAIFWHLMNVDAAGVTHEENTALNRLSSVANAPIFSFVDTFFGEAIVGGPMHSVEQGSAMAAAVALRILDGEKAGDIKTPPTKFASPKFDWRQMQRWGISDSDLPSGSQVYFRESTLWQRYPWQIAFIVAVILVQAGLITILLSEHRHRRLAEVQARQRMAELAHVNRFSTAGELATTIAHEINQPLGAILTNAETAQSMLKAPHPDMDELGNIINDILHDDRRASEVIRRMRSLLRKAPFDPKHTDLNDIVHESVEFLSSLAVARKVELDCLISPDALPIIGDRIQLQQVILNLTVNAMDAMASLPSEARGIGFRTSRAENFAELSISDNGPGISADNLKEIFEPFSTTKAAGLGMGLSIARTIVEAHNGQIWAENRPGAGASFQIRIPLEKTSAAV